MILHKVNEVIDNLLSVAHSVCNDRDILHFSPGTYALSGLYPVFWQRRERQRNRVPQSQGTH